MIWQITKKDLGMLKLYLILVIFLLPLLHAGDFGDIGVYIYLLLFATYFTFYIDSQKAVNRFMVSLPLSRKSIIASRYLVIISVLVGTLLLHYLSDFLLQIIFPQLIFTEVDGLMIFFLLGFLFIHLSVNLPIYYLTKSFLLAFSINFYLSIMAMIVAYAIVNSIALSEFLKGLPVNPYLLLAFISISSLYMSYRLSVFIFSKKDL